MKRPIKLKTKITLLVTVVVLISIAIIMSIVASWMTSNIEEQAKINVENVANIIANSDEIITALEEKDSGHRIEPYVDKMLNQLDQIEYIIVADSNGIRYSHPNPEMVGKKFVGGDEQRVLMTGDVYISEAVGTLGRSLRVFVPIYDIESGEEIGFVSVGTLTASIESAKHKAIGYVLLVGLLGLIVGVIGSVMLADNVKNSLMGLEPLEITRLYHEKMGILDAIHEGLLAVDKDGTVTLINDSALDILRFGEALSKEAIIGKSVENIIPNSQLMKVLRTGRSEFEKEQRINDTIILTNRLPIIDNGEIVGAIASFRDKTIVTRIAEELTGVRKMAWSLRAQNHEFMNKLHTIAGLIQLEEYDSVLKFISDIVKVKRDICLVLTKQIRNEALAAILLAKFSKAEESRITLKIDEASNLTELPQGMTSEDVISIVGNLIDNSMDEVKNDGTGQIYVKIDQDSSYLNITVRDNGGGIPKGLHQQIYEQGFSTKAGQRGHGMYIVRKLISEHGGRIQLQSENGVHWQIGIPMREEMN